MQRDKCSTFCVQSIDIGPVNRKQAAVELKKWGCTEKSTYISEKFLLYSMTVEPEAGDCFRPLHKCFLYRFFYHLVLIIGNAHAPGA